MKNVYNHEQFMDALRTISMDAETFETLEAYSKMLQNRVEFQQSRVNIAAEMLGHNLINESMGYE